jgi:ABC-type nitrate/sulfonate/bicarbonate transport system permease component
MFSAISNPLIEGLRPVPPIALIPFVILWFGLGTGDGFPRSSFVLHDPCYYDLRGCSQRQSHLCSAAKSLGASNNRVYYSVILPAIVPQLVAGVRVAAAFPGPSSSPRSTWERRTASDISFCRQVTRLTHRRFSSVRSRSA